MGIKAVDQVELACQLGTLHRQVVLGATAQNQHIDLRAVRRQTG